MFHHGKERDKNRALENMVDPSIHRHTMWITFDLYVFEPTLCIYFHFALDNPAKAFNLVWIVVHAVIRSYQCTFVVKCCLQVIIFLTDNYFKRS